MNPSSSIVTIFPSSNGAGLPQSRISTEGNVSGILRDIASKNYVVSGLTASGWTPGLIWTTTGTKINIAPGTCVINGYQITTNAIITLSKSNIPTITNSDTGDTLYVVASISRVNDLLKANSDSTAVALDITLTTTKPTDVNSLVIASAPYIAGSLTISSDTWSQDTTRITSDHVDVNGDTLSNKIGGLASASDLDAEITARTQADADIRNKMLTKTDVNQQLSGSIRSGLLNGTAFTPYMFYEPQGRGCYGIIDVPTTTKYRKNAPVLLVHPVASGTGMTNDGFVTETTDTTSDERFIGVNLDALSQGTTGQMTRILTEGYVTYTIGLTAEPVWSVIPSVTGGQVFAGINPAVVVGCPVYCVPRAKLPDSANVVGLVTKYNGFTILIEIGAKFSQTALNYYSEEYRVGTVVDVNASTNRVTIFFRGK